MDTTHKDKLIRRMRRAQGQLNGVSRMIENDEYCVGVLTQIAAVQGALRKIAQIVLDSHVRTCVRDAFEQGDEQERERHIGELMTVFSRYNGLCEGK